MTLALSLEVYSPTKQFLVLDAVISGWSSHYSEEGSGFGYLKFTVEREARSRLHDIDFGYDVILRKGVSDILFHGDIRQIEESNKSNKKTVSVTVLGHAIVFEDDELLRAYCDKRINLWHTLTELPAGLRRPDLFAVGSNELGLYLGATTNAIPSANMYTELVYDSPGDHPLKRIKFDVTSVLGTGVAFAADITDTYSTIFTDEVDSIDAGNSYVFYVNDAGEGDILVDMYLYNVTLDESFKITAIDTVLNRITVSGDVSSWVATNVLTVDDIFTNDVFYDNDSGEDDIVSGMTLYNITQAEQGVISAVVTGSNKITVDSSISNWLEDDRIAVYGPLFSATVSNVSGAVITYADEIGEGNISTGDALVNVTKKSVAVVLSNVTGSDTITVDDEDDLEGWGIGDIISIVTSLFSCTFDSNSTVTVTYSAPTREFIVDSDAGWFIYNEDRDSSATIASWDSASNKFDVTDENDLSSWIATDTLRIYTPFRFGVVDNNGVVLWPSDIRDGGKPLTKFSVNVTTSGDPTQIIMALSNYIAGTANEYTFFQVENVRVYTMTADVTITNVAKDLLQNVMSVAGHGLSTDETQIDTISKVIEPTLAEFSTPKDILNYMASYGDSSLNQIAWGVQLNDKSMMFLEVMDLSSIEYVVRLSAPVDTAMGGDIQKSLQQIRGVYTDKLGEQQLTPWVTDSTKYFNGKYRRKSIKLDNIDTEAEALNVVQKALNEQSSPQSAGKYSAKDGAIFTRNNLPVSFDEVKATGRMVVIEDFRFVKASGEATNISNNFTIEQIVGVEIDYKNKSVNIIPGSAKSTFASYMAELARMVQR